MVTARDLRSRSWTTTPISVAIIVIAAGLFLISRGGETELTLLRNLAQINVLVADGEWWRIVSAALLHGSLTHILFNMYALWIFGPRLEREAGSIPFLTAYVATAAMGGAFYFLLGEDFVPAVGASGAIFGLFGIWVAALWKSRHTPAGRALLNQLLVLLAINAALPLIVPRIAWEAHLGGFAGGLVIGWAWSTYAYGRPNARAIRIAVAAAVGVAAFAIVVL